MRKQRLLMLALVLVVVAVVAMVVVGEVVGVMEMEMIARVHRPV